MCYHSSIYCVELSVSGDNKKQIDSELVLLLFQNSLQGPLIAAPGEDGSLTPIPLPGRPRNDSSSYEL